MQLSQQELFSTSKQSGDKGAETLPTRKDEQPKMSHTLRWDLWFLQYVMLFWAGVFFAAATLTTNSDTPRHFALAIALCGGAAFLNIVRWARDLEL